MHRRDQSDKASQLRGLQTTHQQLMNQYETLQESNHALRMRLRELDPQIPEPQALDELQESIEDTHETSSADSGGEHLEDEAMASNVLQYAEMEPKHSVEKKVNTQARQQLKELQSQLAGVRTDLAAANQQNATLEERASQVNSRLQTADSLHQTAVDKIDRLESTIRVTQKKLQEAAESNNTAAFQQAAETERELKEKAEEQCGDLRSVKANLNSQIVTLNHKIDSLQGDVTRIRSERDTEALEKQHNLQLCEKEAEQRISAKEELDTANDRAAEWRTQAEARYDLLVTSSKEEREKHVSSISFFCLDCRRASHHVPPVRLILLPYCPNLPAEPDQSPGRYHCNRARETRCFARKDKR